MKPDRSILDISFRYVPSLSTSVSDTWRRFGWRPTGDKERKTSPALPPAPIGEVVSPRHESASA